MDDQSDVETVVVLLFFFFFNDTATTEIYTLSLHDALPISRGGMTLEPHHRWTVSAQVLTLDRKSTRLNSSHQAISYAVFCLKKNRNRHRDSPNSHHCGTPTKSRFLSSLT